MGLELLFDFLDIIRISVRASSNLRDEVLSRFDSLCNKYSNEM